MATDEAEWKSLMDEVVANPAPDDTDPLIPDMSAAGGDGPVGVVVTCEADDNLVLIADLRNSQSVKPACSNSFLRFITGRHSDTVMGSDLVKFVVDTRKVYCYMITLYF